MATERRHLTAFLLLQIVEGELPLDSIRSVGVAHLQGCDRCMAIWHRHQQRSARRQGPAALDYGAAIASALAKTEAISRRLDADRAGAEADFRCLLRHRPRQRAALVPAGGRRFRSPILVDLLIAECREAVRRDPREAYSLASVAEAVAARVPARVYGKTFVERVALRALAHRANALRAGGELARAEALWAEILEHLEKSPIGDREVEAELASLEASLRLDQRRLDEAERLLGRAERGYTAVGNEEGRARVLLKRGIAAFTRPDAPAAAGWYAGSRRDIRAHRARRPRCGRPAQPRARPV